MFQNLIKTVLSAAQSANIEWIGDTLYSSNQALLAKAAPLLMRGTPYEIMEVSGVERLALAAPSNIIMYAIRSSDTPPPLDKYIDHDMSTGVFISEEYLETSEGRVVAVLKSTDGDIFTGISGITRDKYNMASCQGEAKVDAIRRFLK